MITPLRPKVRAELDANLGSTEKIVGLFLPVSVTAQNTQPEAVAG
jgi:hypothetical protein